VPIWSGSYLRVLRENHRQEDAEQTPRVAYIYNVPSQEMGFDNFFRPAGAVSCNRIANLSEPRRGGSALVRPAAEAMKRFAEDGML